MHGTGKPIALRAEQEKPRIVVLASADTGIWELVGQLRDRMRTFTIEVLDPFASAKAPDEAVDLVLLRPLWESDIGAYLVAGQRHYPDAVMGLLADSALLASGMALMQSGLIKGVIPLDLSITVLTAVLGILHAGGQYCPPEIVMRVEGPRSSQGLSHDDAPGYAVHGLTPRETEIMGLISQGLQNKLIAAQMGLSEHTVKAHVRNLFAKLRVSNRTQAVVKCRERFGDGKRDRIDERIAGSGAALHLFMG